MKFMGQLLILIGLCQTLRDFAIALTGLIIAGTTIEMEKK